jgi:hypothetical protein
MYRNQVATSSGFGWRIAAELGGDIKRNTQILAKELYKLSEPNKITPFLGDMRKRRLYGTIIFLAFALESFINEIGIECLNSDFDEIERMPTVKKWYLIGNLKSKSLFLKGKEPYQSIIKLFKLRDKFAHDKPTFKDIDSKEYREIRNINHKYVKKLYNNTIESLELLRKVFDIQDSNGSIFEKI